METSTRFWDAALVERLRYVGALLNMMDGGVGIGQKALAGSAAIWIAALDETVLGTNPDCGGSKYSVRRANETGGKTVQALRLARNEVAHGSALVTRSGVRVPMPVPVVWSLGFISGPELASRFSQRLGKSISNHDLALYEKFVSGADPKEVLSRAYEWLSEIAAY